MQKGQTGILILTGIVILIAVAGGIFFLGRVSVPKPEAPVATSSPQPSPLSTETPAQVEDPTTNWKTYTDSQYKFTLKYPPELELELIDGVNNFKQVSLHEKAREPGINVTPIIIRVLGKNIQNAAYAVQQRQDAEKMLELKQGESMQVIGTMFTRTVDTDIDGITAATYAGRAVPGYPAEILPYEKRIIFTKGNDLYVLLVTPLGNSETDKFTDYFNQILSTFRFLP